MAKKLAYFSLALFTSLCAFHTEAAKLSCDDVYGYWSGSIPGYESVNLKLEKNNPVENADIRYRGDYGSLEFGGFIGKCHATADGSLTMDVSRNSYGVNGTINTHLTAANNLEVQFKITWPVTTEYGAGVLHKS